MSESDMRASPSDLPLVLDSVSLRIGAVSLIEAAQARFLPGAPSLLIGANGSGKTSLLRLAMGLVAPSAGTVTWGGRRDAPLTRRAIVFQKPVMLRRSVAGNIAYALRLSGGEPAALDALLAQAGLTALAARPARALSGGEQQRLALARALARRPEILFLDEPTASLDPAATRAVEAIILGAAQAGVKIIMATHDLGQARRLAGDVVFLLRGRTHETGAAEKIFNGPQSAETAAFLRGELVI